MLVKKTVVEYDMQTDEGTMYRFSHMPDSKVVCVQEIWANGELGDDLLSFNAYDLDKMIEILKDIRGY